MLIPPYVLIKDDNQPSPHPSPIGEGVSNSHPELVSGSNQILKHRGQSDVQKMLKQVQHDANSLKRTYSLINLLSIFFYFSNQAINKIYIYVILKI